MQRQKVGPVLRAALLESELGDLVVGQRRIEVVETAQAGDVGDGFNVEDEDGFHTEILA